MTPGEIVIPHGLQTPEVLSALRSAAQSAGLDATKSSVTPVPGEVRNDDLNQPHETLVIPTSPAQDKAVQGYIDARKANPGDYDLWLRQCTDFGAGGVRAAGEVVPTDWTSDVTDKMRPGSFFDQLKRWNGR